MTTCLGASFLVGHWTDQLTVFFPPYLVIIVYIFFTQIQQCSSEPKRRNIVVLFWLHRADLTAPSSIYLSTPSRIAIDLKIDSFVVLYHTHKVLQHIRTVINLFLIRCHNIGPSKPDSLNIG